MKSFLLLLPLFGALSLAQSLTSDCQCPLVKCPSDDPVKLCQCLNSRETACKKACPTYKPTYLPCPVSPLAPAPTCSCDPGMCIQVWPQSCYCANANKQRCYDKCGGVKPDLQECPPLENPTLVTKAVPTPKVVDDYTICGGGRGNYRQCGEGENCIADPRKPGSCGPACDQLGICVSDEQCGGFAGLPCMAKGKVCKDDPRDDCDPKNGGADCIGMCVWPSSLI